MKGVIVNLVSSSGVLMWAEILRPDVKPSDYLTGLVKISNWDNPVLSLQSIGIAQGVSVYAFAAEFLDAE